MNSLPQGSISFRWRDHFSALRWLGLLYRRPKQFRDTLLACSVKRQLIIALWLLIHSAPYVLAVSVGGKLLVARVPDANIERDPLAFTIVLGIAFGAVLGIVSGIVLGIVRALAGSIAGGAISVIVLGIAAVIVSSIASGFARGGVGFVAIVGFGEQRNRKPA